MNVRTEWNGFAWLEQYAWLILPLIFWGVIWRQILIHHQKHPIPLGIMTAWIAYTVLTLSLLVLGVLWSGAFFVAFVCLTFSMFVWFPAAARNCTSRVGSNTIPMIRTKSRKSNTRTVARRCFLLLGLSCSAYRSYAYSSVSRISHGCRGKHKTPTDSRPSVFPFCHYAASTMLRESNHSGKYPIYRCLRGK